MFAAIRRWRGQTLLSTIVLFPNALKALSEGRSGFGRAALYHARCWPLPSPPVYQTSIVDTLQLFLIQGGMASVRVLLGRFGSLQHVRDALGRVPGVKAPTMQAISSWQVNNRIPAGWFPALLDAAEAEGVGLTADELSDARRAPARAPKGQQSAA